MRNWGIYLPSSSVQFLSLEEVIEIHVALIEQFGGASGIRDEG